MSAAPIPRVSVVIPTRNREKLLPETLTCLQAQTLSEWEAVIVDDGSTDGTRSILADYERTDARFRPHAREAEPRGVCACRNIGLSRAQAPLIVFLDSDDLLTPGCLQARVAAMDANQNLDFAVWRCERFLKRPGDLGQPFAGDTLEGDLDRYLRWDVPWQTAGPIWRREALERLGGWDITMPSATDLDIGIRALAARCSYIRFPERDCFWRADPEEESITSHLFDDDDHLDVLLLTFAKWQRVIDENGLLNLARRRLLAGLHFLVAGHWLRKRRVRKALAAWTAAHRAGLISRQIHLEGLGVIRLRAAMPNRRPLQTWVHIRRLTG